MCHSIFFVIMKSPYIELSVAKTRKLSRLLLIGGFAEFIQIHLLQMTVWVSFVFHTTERKPMDSGRQLFRRDRIPFYVDPQCPGLCPHSRFAHPLTYTTSPIEISASDGDDTVIVINQSINESLSRTIVTSLTTFLVVLILFLVLI